AIGEIDARQGGELRMLVLVLDADAEIAASPVEIKRSGLERPLAAAGVEIAERDKVIEERQQVAPQAGELFDPRDGVHLRLERLVAGDERIDPRLDVRV